MRPIDADALIKKCGGWYVEEGTESGFIGTLKNLLATEPTIQPEKEQLSCEGTTSGTISRQAAIDRFKVIRPVDPKKDEYTKGIDVGIAMCIVAVKDQPSTQPEDYTELKREFLRMASYIDVLLECSDAQKETLNGFISRLAEFMPWTERV